MVRKQIIERYFSFQFLMVRLKVAIGEYTAASPEQISIPYGAIKSGSKSKVNPNKANFNSLWCD